MPRWIYALLVLCLGLVCLRVCTSQGLKTILHSQGPLHPWFHLAAFAGLAFMLMHSFHRLKIALPLVCCLIALGWGSEYREHLRNHDPIEWMDVALNVSGIALGAVVGYFTRSMLRTGVNRVRVRAQNHVRDRRERRAHRVRNRASYKLNSYTRV